MTVMTAAETVMTEMTDTDRMAAHKRCAALGGRISGASKGMRAAESAGDLTAYDACAARARELRSELQEAKVALKTGMLPI
jgi:hypothetical protein